MKKLFSGYYHPTDKEFEKLWEECIFVFDANVLLNLYRYSPKTSTDMINILKNISDRVWIPHQTALEFHNHRLSIISEQVNSYSNIQDDIKKMQNKISDTLHSKKHPFIKNSDKLLGSAEKIFNKISGELEKRKEDYLASLKIDGNHDTILQEVTLIFDGKTGLEYPNDQLTENYNKGKKRYAQNIPPGYMDEVKGDEVRKYGDLLIWFQTIDKAKDSKKSVILITDDKKEDWWREHKGETIGPRPELIQEFLAESGKNFYMYSMDNFIDKAQKYLEEKVEKETIQEARELRRQNEERHKNAVNLAQIAAQLSKPSPRLTDLGKLIRKQQSPEVSDLAKLIREQQSPEVSDLAKLMAQIKKQQDIDMTNNDDKSESIDSEE